MDYHYKQALRHAISREQKRRRQREARMNLVPSEGPRPLTCEKHYRWAELNGRG